MFGSVFGLWACVCSIWFMNFLKVIIWYWWAQWWYWPFCFRALSPLSLQWPCSVCVVAPLSKPRDYNLTINQCKRIPVRPCTWTNSTDTLTIQYVCVQTLWWSIFTLNLMGYAITYTSNLWVPLWVSFLLGFIEVGKLILNVGDSILPGEITS